MSWYYVFFFLFFIENRYKKKLHRCDSLIRCYAQSVLYDVCTMIQREIFPSVSSRDPYIPQYSILSELKLRMSHRCHVHARHD